MTNSWIWILSLIAVSVGIGLTPRPVFAYGESEDELFAEDLREARSRARDFTAQKVREANEELKRQEGVAEVKRDRSEFEADQEKQRRSFIVERNTKPSEWKEQARLERQFEMKAIEDEREMDKSRRSYKQKRARIQHLIKSEAQIDENQEFGL